MQNLWTFLTGKKSYLIAAATLVYGVATWYIGPRTPETDQALIAFVSGSAGLAALRHGITTSLSPAVVSFFEALAPQVLARISQAFPPAPPKVVAAVAPGLKDVHDTILAAIGNGADPTAVTQIAGAAVNTAAILTPPPATGA